MVKGGVRYSAAGFHSLLVPIDLSPASDRVVGRVAQLPLAEGCRITLLHVISMDLPVRDRKRAEVAARKVLRAEAQELGRQLPRGVALQSVVAQGAAATEIARYATSVKAELVVMGRYGGSVLRDVFLGSTAERVIRRGQLPVLAVRLRARTPYRHPALALDIDQAANESVAMLLRNAQAGHRTNRPKDGHRPPRARDARSLGCRLHLSGHGRRRRPPQRGVRCVGRTASPTALSQKGTVVPNAASSGVRARRSRGPLFRPRCRARSVSARSIRAWSSRRSRPAQRESRG